MKKIILFIILFSLYSGTYAQNSIYIEKSNAKIDLKIDIPKSENTTINKTLIAYIGQVWGDFMKNTNQLETLSQNWKYDFTLIGEEKKVGTFTTYKLSLYEFTGGAHGNTTIQTFNFDSNGKNIDILNKNLIHYASVYSIKYFQDALKKGDFDSNNDWILQGLEEKKENFKNYLITNINPQSITIEFIFDQYQIGPYYLGNQIIEIPIKK